MGSEMCIRDRVTPDPAVCGAFLYGALPSCVVGQSLDPEMDPVTIQLQVFAGDQNPEGTVALFDQSQAQGGTTSTFDIASVAFQEQSRYRLRARASDPTGPSQWTDCLFTYSSHVPGSSSGTSGLAPSSSEMGSSGGGTASSGTAVSGRVLSGIHVSTDGNSGGDGSTQPSSCGCRSSDGAPPCLALGLLVLARRRFNARVRAAR